MSGAKSVYVFSVNVLTVKTLSVNTPTHKHVNTSIVPDRPGLLSLYVKHLKTILDIGSAHFCLLKEQCPGRIIDEVVDVMLLGDLFVVDRCDRSSVRRHSKRSGVDDQVGTAEQLGVFCQVFVCVSAFAFFP